MTIDLKELNEELAREAFKALTPNERELALEVSAIREECLEGVIQEINVVINESIKKYSKLYAEKVIELYEKYKAGKE